MSARWFDQFKIGDKATLGSHHFDRESIIAFAKKFDPQRFHLDDEEARNSHFGALCASGWHTAAAFMKCNSAFVFAQREKAEKRGETLPPLGPSPGVENLRWMKPVFVDDTITYTAEVIDKRELNSRDDWGLVTLDMRGVNQKGEPVFSVVSKLLVGRRN